MQFSVKFTVEFETVVEAESEEDVGNAASDITIPESEAVKYVPDSFAITKIERATA